MKSKWQRFNDFIVDHIYMIAAIGVLILLVLLTKVALSAGFTRNDNTTYYGTTDQVITAAWDPVENANYYNVALYSVERDAAIPATTQKVTIASATLQLPFSGHFIVKVQACKDGNPPVCSDWTLSTDPAGASVDNKPHGWWIYGHVEKPGSIQIK